METSNLRNILNNTPPGSVTIDRITMVNKKSLVCFANVRVGFGEGLAYLIPNVCFYRTPAGKEFSKPKSDTVPYIDKDGKEAYAPHGYMSDKLGDMITEAISKKLAPPKLPKPDRTFAAPANFAAVDNDDTFVAVDPLEDEDDKNFELPF